jgi:6-phosphogluconate dehydrogenase
MKDEKCDIGMVGVGVMGGNLVLNMTDHGFSVVVYDVAAEKTRKFVEDQGRGRKIFPGYTVEEFVNRLSRPRSILILVPAGPPVDAAIEGLLPFLERSDLIIDSGNSYFTDTARREKYLEEHGILFLGMGISGGEEGARYGPSLMPGGSREGYERVEPILRAVAAEVNGEPCETYLGPGFAGHYVKMIHNGIEYGIMQLIAESYDLLKRGLNTSNDSLAAIYAKWNESELNSYLIEITSKIFQRKDDGEPTSFLIDRILDRAKQKGTGKWTSCEAMDLLIPTPNIDAAVQMRNLSASSKDRMMTGKVLKGPDGRLEIDAAGFPDLLENALYFGMVVTYCQGMAMLRQASATYGFQMSLEGVARIWRGGCIIRAALLEKIRSAYREEPDLPSLLLSPYFAQLLSDRQAEVRAAVRAAIDLGIPVPGLMASLAYYDSCRSPRLPANLIQAQRDFFGAHTYERTDIPGIFHTDWSEK